jgi:hypothetical protein
MKKPTITMYYEEGYSAPDLIGGREWVTELMSGKYKRGVGSLCQTTVKENEDGEEIIVDKKYCCLGVDCQMRGLFTGKSNVAGYMFADVGNHTSTTTLPYGHPWQILFNCDMKFPEGFRIEVSGSNVKFPDITILNDYRQGIFSFTTIAAVIQTAWNCLPNPPLS